MHRDPLAHADADGSQLAMIGPDAGESVAACGVDTEMRAGVDQDILDHAQVRVQVAVSEVQIENRIAHELTRAVVGRLTAAICFVDRMRQL
jgi:hypothetical protein